MRNSQSTSLHNSLQVCDAEPSLPSLIAAQGGIDLRLMLASALPLSYDDIYSVEATTWGVDGGFVPPPCPASLRVIEASLPEAKRPVSAPFVLRHPPRPFRLFEGEL